jgi:hypothetical protein
MRRDILSPIVFSPSAVSDQLHAISDNVWTGVSNQKMNVVARHDVIKYRPAEALFRFENPARITLPVAASELAEGQIPILMKRLERSAAIERLELSFSALVSDVPDVARQEMAIRPGSEPR